MTVEIRDELRQKGYNTKCVNGTCYDIKQAGFVHYLSAAEGEELNQAKLNHPVNLFDYATKMGLNYWYNFDVEKS